MTNISDSGVMIMGVKNVFGYLNWSFFWQGSPDLKVFAAYSFHLLDNKMASHSLIIFHIQKVKLHTPDIVSHFFKWMELWFALQNANQFVWILRQSTWIICFVWSAL